MFKNSVYIGKVTGDLIELLEDLGYKGEVNSGDIDPERYKNCGIATSGVNGTFSIINKLSWENSNPHITWNTAGRINCGVDEVRFYDLVKELSND